MPGLYSLHLLIPTTTIAYQTTLRTPKHSTTVLRHTAPYSTTLHHSTQSYSTILQHTPPQYSVIFHDTPSDLSAIPALPNNTQPHSTILHHSSPPHSTTALPLTHNTPLHSTTVRLLTLKTHRTSTYIYVYAYIYSRHINLSVVPHRDDSAIFSAIQWSLWRACKTSQLIHIYALDAYSMHIYSFWPYE